MSVFQDEKNWFSRIIIASVFRKYHKFINKRRWWEWVLPASTPFNARVIYSIHSSWVKLNRMHLKLVSHQIFIKINNEENDLRDALSRRHLIGFARKHQFHRLWNILKPLYCLSKVEPYQPIAWSPNRIIIPITSKLADQFILEQSHTAHQ